MQDEAQRKDAAFNWEDPFLIEDQLSDEERAILEPALERAKRGEFASDAEVDEVLKKPWS